MLRLTETVLLPGFCRFFCHFNCCWSHKLVTNELNKISIGQPGHRVCQRHGLDDRSLVDLAWQRHLTAYQDEGGGEDADDDQEQDQEVLQRHLPVDGDVV